MGRCPPEDPQRWTTSDGGRGFAEIQTLSHQDAPLRQNALLNLSWAANATSGFPLLSSLPSPPAPLSSSPRQGGTRGGCGTGWGAGFVGFTRFRPDATESVVPKLQCGCHILVSLPGDQPATCRCVPCKARAHRIPPAAQLGRASPVETHGAVKPAAFHGNLSILSKCPVSAVRFSTAPWIPGSMRVNCSSMGESCSGYKGSAMGPGAGLMAPISLFSPGRVFCHLKAH